MSRSGPDTGRFEVAPRRKARWMAEEYGGERGPVEKKWWTLIAVCLGTFMLLLDVTVVVVAQPASQDRLHAGFSAVQWILDASALTLASLLLTSGVLADRYGRRRLFAIGLTVFTLGSLLCGLAVSPPM